MDACRVERVLAAADAQETRGVEVCLGSQLGDLLKLAAIGKGAVFLAVGHDVLGHARCNARYVSQQACACGVHVDAHAVDDVLHHVAQGARELGLVKVVLVLAHADGLGRNLDELCQRVLQAAAQAHGATHGDVQIGILLTGELGGGVHRRAGLVDDGVSQLRCLLGDELRDDFLGLAAGGAVADDDGVDAVLLDEAGELALGAGDVVARLGGVDHAVVEQLAGLVHDGDLAAGAVARIEREHAGAAHGACREQAFEILGKDVDGLGLGANGEFGAGLALQRGSHEALVAVGDSGVKDGREDALATGPAAAEARRGSGAVDVHAHAEFALALTAVDSQHAVVGYTAQRLIIAVVRLVGGLLGGVGGLDDDVGGVLRKGAQVGDVLGVLGYCLGHDVHRTGERLLGRVEAGFLVDVCRGGVERAALGRGLHDDHVGERLQACLAGLLRAGHALFAVGLIEVLDTLELRGLANLLLKLGREFALGVDEQDDILFALLKIAQVGQALVERAQGDVVHSACGFLAVARDKGDGVALVDELDGRLDVGGLKVELAGELGDKIHETPCGKGAFAAQSYQGYHPSQKAVLGPHHENGLSTTFEP